MGRKTKYVGFQSMTPERLREVTRKGGLSAHRQGTGRQWTPAEARAAGRLGARRRAEQRAAKKERGE